MDTNLIKNDLQTFNKKDIQTLYRFYKVNNTQDLIAKIYRSGTLPAGSVFDAIENNKFEDFMEFLND